MTHFVVKWWLKFEIKLICADVNCSIVPTRIWFKFILYYIIFLKFFFLQKIFYIKPLSRACVGNGVLHVTNLNYTC